MQTPPRTPFAAALSALQQPDDTLLTLLMRLKAQEPCPTGLPLLDLLHEGQGLQPCDVVELCGDAGAGKTALLLHAVARLLAATEPVHEGSLSGALRAGARVAFFPLDGRFSAQALALTVAGALAREGMGQAAAAAPGVPVRSLRSRLRSALARVDVHPCAAPGAAPLEALEALAAPSAPPLALLVLDGMGLAWHWGCKLYGGSRALEELQARLAGALERVRAHTRCRILWARPALFGRVEAVLRAPSSASSASAASAQAAARALAEGAAEEAAEGAQGLLRCPTLHSSMPTATLPGLVSHAMLHSAAAADVLTGSLGAMVTHRVLLTRLRGLAGGAGSAGAREEPHPALAAAAAAACQSASAGHPCAVQLRCASGSALPAQHPSDTHWVASFGAAASAASSSSSSSSGGGGGGVDTSLHTVLVAARMASREGPIMESILALCV